MMNKLNYNYTINKNKELKQKKQQQQQRQQYQSPPILKPWIVESKHSIQQKRASLLSKPKPKPKANDINNKKLINKKKKKVIRKKSNNNNNNNNNDDDDDNNNVPIDIVLKFSASLEMASRNLIKLTAKLKNTINTTGILTNNSYVKSNNTSINSTPPLHAKTNTSTTYSPNSNSNNNYGQKFNDDEEEELDYLVKARLKKRLIEIINNGHSFANTI